MAGYRVAFSGGRAGGHSEIWKSPIRVFNSAKSIVYSISIIPQLLSIIQWTGRQKDAIPVAR